MSRNSVFLMLLQKGLLFIYFVRKGIFITREKLFVATSGGGGYPLFFSFAFLHYSYPHISLHQRTYNYPELENRSYFFSLKRITHNYKVRTHMNIRIYKN